MKGVSKMNIFENHRINKTNERIKALKKECVNRRIYDVRMNLERISTSLANRVGKYTRKQYKLVNGCIDNVAKYLSSDNSDIIKNECTKACNIIYGTYVVPSKAEQMINEDEMKINALEAKLRNIHKSSKEIVAKMDQALDNQDEITWKRLNKEKSFLNGQLMAVNQAFDALVTSTNNLKIAQEIREIREKYSDFVSEQQPLVDMEEFANNVETNKYVCEESIRQDAEMSKLLFESAADDNDAYRRALEARMEKNQINPVGMTDSPSLAGAEPIRP